jgi:regulator of RNase E activity RraA
MYGFAPLAAAFLASSLAPMPARAQLWTWTKDQMVEYTKAWTGDRLPDGRPKVPDAWIARAMDMSSEEVIINWGGRGGGGGFGPGGGGGVQGYGQYVGDFEITHPDKHMAGRAFTMMFLPTRPDLDPIVNSKLQARGVQTPTSIQYALDMLQPGDVVVVDLYGKKLGPMAVGEDLLYYIDKATKGGGLVVDGSFRDLDGLANMGMPSYYRDAHQSVLAPQTATLAGVNVPIRIGDVTVMPGDLVLGDREGVSFIPPQLAEGVLNSADTTHVHDEWTKKKFDEGKYKSTDIYSVPRTQELRTEYQQFLQKRLQEIHAQQQK